MKSQRKLYFTVFFVLLLLFGFWQFIKTDYIKPIISKENLSLSVNITGSPLEICSEAPLTGFYRNGKCDTGADDYGVHVVCAKMTAEFLKYTAELGNDLMTPAPERNFPGLKEGDNWCICADRWQEAYEAGSAPTIVEKATHQKALLHIDKNYLNQLKSQSN